MRNRLLKKVIYIFVFMACISFINVSGVSAVTCDYGIECTYEFCGSRDSSQGGSNGNMATSCPNNVGNVILDSVYKCSDVSKKAKKCNSFVSWANATKNNGTRTKAVTISNHSEIFGNVDDSVVGTKNYKNVTLKDRFNSKGYSCPTIYVNFTKSSNDNSYKISYMAPGKQVFAKSKCVAKDENPDTKEVAKKEAETTATDHIEKSIEDDDSVDPSVDQVTNWAKSAGYGDSTAVGDACSIITPTLRKLLSDIFFIISLASLVLLVSMTAVGFIKALVGSDDEKLRDAFKHLLSRIIVAIVLLLLPTILTFIIDIVNDNMTGNVSIGKDGNVFCDVTK